jgi:heat shock protein HtpX
MIAALERLKAGTAELPESMTAFGIGGGRMSALFSTHPPLDARIAALRADRG